MKKLIKKLLGVKEFLDAYEQFCYLKYEWINDTTFETLYSNACKATQTASFLPHKMRSYMLYSLLKNIPEGEIAECGVFRGVTAHQMQAFTHRTIHLFDSFEGTSPTDTNDVRNPESLGVGGICNCPLEQVKENLRGDFKFYRGWIPDRFKEVGNLKFAFVHVDVDVYQPTKDSFDFFYPRMVRGGVIVCDDYGFLGWPGCKKAVDEMATKHGFKAISLTTGQCVVFK